MRGDGVHYVGGGEGAPPPLQAAALAQAAPVKCPRISAQRLLAGGGLAAAISLPPSRIAYGQ
jgi:hypothetical protein